MERMLCTHCAAVSYSAAAARLVERGERCPTCGGPLVLDPDRAIRVGAEPERGDDRSRRFEPDS